MIVDADTCRGTVARLIIPKPLAHPRCIILPRIILPSLPWFRPTRLDTVSEWRGRKIWEVGKLAASKRGGVAISSDRVFATFKERGGAAR